MPDNNDSDPDSDRDDEFPEAPRPDDLDDDHSGERERAGVPREELPEDLREIEEQLDEFEDAGDDVNVDVDVGASPSANDRSEIVGPDAQAASGGGSGDDSASDADSSGGGSGGGVDRVHPEQSPLFERVRARLLGDRGEDGEGEGDSDGDGETGVLAGVFGSGDGDGDGDGDGGGVDVDEDRRDFSIDVGAWVGYVVAAPALYSAYFVKAVVFGFALTLFRILPLTDGFWRGLIKAGYKGLLKTSGGEVVGHIMHQGRLVHKPLQWDDENHRYVDKDENWWNAAGEADNHYLAFNRVPSVWAASDATELGNHVKAETAEVLDIGGGTEVYRDAQVTHVTMQPDDGGGQQAVADGGGVQQYYSVESPGVLGDFLVDLSTQRGDAGRVVSGEKYHETQWAKSDPEEMQAQEMRGRLAEKDPDADRSFVIKVMLIAAAIIAIVYLGPDLIAAFFGGGGGGSSGGGGMIPFTLGGGF